MNIYSPVRVVEWDVYLCEFFSCKIVTVVDACFKRVEGTDSVEHSTDNKRVGNFIFLKKKMYKVPYISKN